MIKKKKKIQGSNILKTTGVAIKDNIQASLDALISIPTYPAQNSFKLIDRL